jgi:dihydrofolate synthase / folylpolyglutamate synthase
MINKWYEEILREFFHTEKIEDYSLDKITRACEYFWNPQNSFKSIHIAGTNGKWSTSKMIFQMLKESWKSVWVYTNPHNIDIRERFETQTWLISQDDFARIATGIIDYGHELSYYEKCVILAFLYFREQNCEYAVIEVGMWGRLDATNIITPVLSIITSISYDHMEYLWETLEQIATEKWGIIKQWIPVILYGKNQTLQNISHERNAPIILPELRTVTTNLLGKHQLSNARIAYEAWCFLWIDESIIKYSLMHVEHHGRLEYIRPNLLIDGAHNEAGMVQLREYVDSISDDWEEICYCFGLKEWKRSSLVLDIFPEVHEWHIVDVSGFRLQNPQSLLEQVWESWESGIILSSSEILHRANQYPHTLFVIFGSLYMIGEFLKE